MTLLTPEQISIDCEAFKRDGNYKGVLKLQPDFNYIISFLNKLNHNLLYEKIDSYIKCTIELFDNPNMKNQKVEALSTTVKGATIKAFQFLGYGLNLENVSYTIDLKYFDYEYKQDKIVCKNKFFVKNIIYSMDYSIKKIEIIDIFFNKRYCNISNNVIKYSIEKEEKPLNQEATKTQIDFINVMWDYDIEKFRNEYQSIIIEHRFNLGKIKILQYSFDEAFDLINKLLTKQNELLQGLEVKEVIIQKLN